MMRKSLCIIVSLLFAVAVFAQTTGRLTGVVKAKGGAPIAGASVTITSKDNSKISFAIKSDNKGIYSQIGLTPGSYVVEVSMAGYMPSSAEWKVKLGEATVLDFELIEMPKAVSAVKEGPGIADYKQAAQLFDAGKFQEALDPLNRALTADPKNPVFLGKLGIIDEKLGKMADAEAAFARVVEVDPSSFAGWFNLGHIRFGLKNYAGAAEALEQATKINSNEAEAFYNLGSARFNESKIPEAVAAFERAIHIKPDHALAHYWLGNGYVNVGKMSEAKIEFQKFIELASPSDPLVPQAKAMLDALAKM